MNELLLIYVPGLQLIKHSFVQARLGNRSIMGDKDLKYVLTVNNRVMNHRTQAGVVSERNMMLLNDVQSIEVVRGPGSAIHGLGAISMVINITTKKGSSILGAHTRVQAHAGQERYSVEFERGSQFGTNQQGSVYLYGGISDVPGASNDNAPFIFPRTFTAIDGTAVLAGEPATTFYNRDGSTYRGLTALKLHAEVEWQALNLWARFTRDGEQYASRAINVAPRPQGNSRLTEIDVSETGYQQLTLHMN